MNEYEISPLADHDLDEIAFFIAADSPESAVRVLDAASEAFQKLADNPALGQIRRFGLDRDPPFRAWPIRGFENYVIYYRQTPRGIVVVRVLHGARLAERLIDETQE